MKSNCTRSRFYSNSVRIPIQQELADKLGKLAAKKITNCSCVISGAEANENALKLASFHNGRKKDRCISLNHFMAEHHWQLQQQTIPIIVAPVNETDNVIFLPFNDEAALEECFTENGNEISSVIVEGIQGVGGIKVATEHFCKRSGSLCDKYGAVFIADSVQCGYGRTGKFFSHDHAV